VVLLILETKQFEDRLNSALGLLIAIVGDDLKDLIPTLWIPLYFRYSCAVN